MEMLRNKTKMWQISIIIAVVFAASFDVIHCHIARPPLPDSAEARRLFQVADHEENGTTDGYLTKLEIVDIFKAFDKNGDNLVNESEFLERWKFKNLGTVTEAETIFKNLDTDQDSFITQVPDLSRAFTYFDRNDDERVSEAEFIVVWQSLARAS